MRRAIKKEVNLNKLKTGCSPCMSEAKKMNQKISDRKISDIKIEEVKIIISSMFKKNWKFDVNFLGLNASWILHSCRFDQGIKIKMKLNILKSKN